MTLVTDRAKLISISLLIMLSMSLFVGIVSEDATAAGAAAGYPHLEAEYTVNPESISSIDDEVVVTLRIKGIGGKVEDLPPDILEKLPRKPLDVVLVLDKSGSMESTDYPPDRMTAAKEAAKIFVNQIKEDDRVAVVSFSSSTSTVVSFTSDKDSAKSKIGGISTGGGTAVGEGIITALDVLENGRDESVKAIVLLSDGAHNTGISPITAANRAKDRGIPIYTVGIGTVGGGIDPLDEDTLKEIARITGGEYLYAPDESALKAVYEKLSTKVLNVAGTNVTIWLEPTAFFDIERREPSSLFFDTIPPDTEKTVEITGKLMVSTPHERIPIIQKYTIRYQDIVKKYKFITGGPIYVEFSGVTEPSEVKLIGVEFEGTDESYEDVECAGGTHKDSTVYPLSDEVEVDIEISNPDDVTVTSVASIYEGTTGNGSADSQKTDENRMTHNLANGGVIGSYFFSDLLYYPPGTLTDYEDDTIYVVFDDEDDVDDKWSDSTKAKNRNRRKPVSIHQKSKDILELTTDWCSGSCLRAEAATKILDCLYYYIEYTKEKKIGRDWDSDYTILDLNGENRKAGETGKPTGTCADYAVAYTSCLRSVNNPVRGISLSFEEDKKPAGHAFTEVYDNEWIHTDPTWNRYNVPDDYLVSGFRKIEGFVEEKPGKKSNDKLTTIKYAVGMIFPVITTWGEIDLNKGKQIKQIILFRNRAKSTDDWWLPDLIDPEDYIAEDFDIKVDIDDEFSDKLEAKITDLDDDDTLDINELDYCILTIKVLDEYAKTIKEGTSENVPIPLKVKYKTIDGEKVEKEYTFYVDVKR